MTQIAKTSKILKVSLTVLSLDAHHGHLAWQVTRLARSSRVARSWIYANLGSTKEKIVESALVTVLEEIYGLNDERRDVDPHLTTFEGVWRSRDIVLEQPELLSFYFLHRARPTKIAQIIRDYEAKYFARVQQQTSVRGRLPALFIRTFIHGLALAPFVSREEFKDLALELSQIVDRWKHDGRVD